MIPTDYNENYDEQIYDNNQESETDNDYDIVRVEEEYDAADPYNFYPDGSF